MRKSCIFFVLMSSLSCAAGCAPESTSRVDGADLVDETQSASALRAKFPVHAADVLDQRRGFVGGSGGFTLDDGEEGSGWRRILIGLPEDAALGATVGVNTGFSVRVRELGLDGRGTKVGNAVAYRRAGGTSFWAAGTDHGVEEWISLDEGKAEADKPVAAWEIEGATLRLRGQVVEVVDETGFVQMAVTAPRAYAGAEREIEARLAVVGSRIELFADGGGEALLVDPAWSAGSPMQSGRSSHRLVKLLDGRVFVMGGTTPGGITNSTEMYDPATATWTLKAPMASARNQHTANLLLPTGKVLVVGGQIGWCGAEVYDPAANNWSSAGVMSACRFEHSATTLSNNTVLIAGGSYNANFLNGVEIYNPSTNLWSSVAPMLTARAYHRAIRLTDGRVLVAGGYNSSGTLGLAEVYNPVNNTWTATANPMAAARASPEVALLSSGHVMVAGGEDATSLKTVDIYDPQTNLWSVGPPMINARWKFVFEPMSMGRFLAAGYSVTEVFDESLGAWKYAGPLSTMREYPAGTLLSNGSVLVTGGYNGTHQNTVDVFAALSQGASCFNAGECQSLNCVDGKCCNTACVGQCVACSAALKGSGADGVCDNIGAALDPNNECGFQAAATCGTTGVCSGAGACQFYSNSTVCVAGSCNGSLATKPDLCSGNGVCVDAGTQQCAPFACSGGVCSVSCASDAQCAAGNYCSAPNCLPKKVTGTPCSTASQCQSGSCADGVCCATACTGTCTACSAAKTGAADGTCAAIPGGQDPDNECSDQGAPTCGQTGVCDGGGACELYWNGVACGPPSCVGTVLQYADQCNGIGNCLDGGSQQCAPYACNLAGCLVTCAGDLDCAPSSYCVAPSCVLKKAKGSACGGAGQCESGACVDGVCCDSACNGKCVACTVVKKGGGIDGACGPIASGTDPDSECPSNPPATCAGTGSCDGVGACQLFAQGAECGAATCNGTVLSMTDMCNGSGTCVDGGSIDCAPFACDVTGCLEVCFDDAQCAQAAYCSAPDCLPKAADGSTCAAASQCASGFCSDGVCCDGACSGLCEACSASKKGGGADGVCAAVTAGDDPDDDCAPDAACENSGQCDGAGACQKDAPGTTCSTAGCAGSAWSPAGLCDGEGTCIDAVTEDCEPFACNPDGCLTVCMDDSNCAATAYCEGSTCVAKDPDGEPCDSAGTCQSSFCVDGVCCGSACDATCSACSAEKKGGGADGTCGPLPAGTDPDGECAATGMTTCGNPGSCDGQGACKKDTEDCSSAGSEETKSFYACTAAPSVPGDTSLAGLLFLGAGLMAARRARRHTR